MPGHHIRGGLQRQVEDGGGQGRAGHVAAGNYRQTQLTKYKHNLAAPRHPGQETSDTLLCQQDGPEGRDVQCQGLADSRPGEVAGQAVAHLRQ